MHARVWQLHIRPGKVQDFQAILSSLVDLARQQKGYRGILALASGKSESPDVNLVAPVAGFSPMYLRLSANWKIHCKHSNSRLTVAPFTIWFGSRLDGWQRR